MTKTVCEWLKEQRAGDGARPVRVEIHGKSLLSCTPERLLAL